MVYIFRHAARPHHSRCRPDRSPEPRLSARAVRVDRGDRLVEIQGQGEQRGLLDPATHRALLDDVAEHEAALAALADSWREWRAARERAEAAARRLAESRAEEDLLRHHKAELDAVAPE